MSAPNARTAFTLMAESMVDLDEATAHDATMHAWDALRAEAGGGRYVVIDTEGADGDGTVWSLARLSPTEVDVSLMYDDEPLYRLTQPGDGG